MNDLTAVFNLKLGEKVIFVLRRHPIVFLVEALIVAVLAAVPFALYFLLAKFWPDLLLGPISRPTLILAGSAYLLLVWHFLIGRFVEYYLDLWVVTDHKIHNVEQKNLFSRTVSELDLASVQDVTSEIKGVIPTLLDYGDVHVQTAAEKERFSFEQVPHPEKVRAALLGLVETDKKRMLGGGT